MPQILSIGSLLDAIEQLLRTNRQPLVVVAGDDAEADSIVRQLGFFAPRRTVLHFPAWDTLPYEKAAPAPEVMAKRALALQALGSAQRIHVVVLTAAAFVQRFPSPARFGTLSLALAVADQVDFRGIADTLMHFGYGRAEIVRVKGEFAIRGDLFDVFDPNRDKPVRIELFDDEIESIHEFDPITQRREGAAGGGDSIRTITLAPASELPYPLTIAEPTRFPLATHPTLHALSEGHYTAGIEQYLPIMDSAPLVAWPEWIAENTWQLLFSRPGMDALDDRFHLIADHYSAREDAAIFAAPEEDTQERKRADWPPLPPEALYLLPEPLQEWVAQQAHVYALAADAVSAKLFFPEFPLARNRGDLLELLPQWRGTRQVLFAMYSEEAAELLQSRLSKIPGWAPAIPIRTARQIGTVRDHATPLIAVLPIPHGWVTDELVVITDSELNDTRIRRRSIRKKMLSLSELNAFEIGELLVHIDHGVGRYEGLETIDLDRNLQTDCVKLAYADGDLLFVPLSQLDALSRYGRGELSLDRLGGAAWVRRRGKIQRDLMAMAETLIAKAAVRSTAQAERFASDDHDAYLAFCVGSGFVETEDQEQAIDEVIGDLASGRPMDRLICGDVGFGKTEIALRAAYVVAMSGQQVALLAPTTLLVRQHLNVFTRRFADTPVRVGAISRLHTPKANKETRVATKEGRIDILIGTHALLSKSTEFAQLGLIIVDEEQQFGVKQKETVKGFAPGSHLLTLTATPIPRSMQFATHGLRELSLVTTPPIDRLAVRTHVMEFDPIIMREAIRRELGRNGQLFYVCPHIADLPRISARLESIAPDLRVVVAHGQLPSSELELRMREFLEGKHDLLLATAIIESGLDIPRANTMFIEDSQRFGLSQLHQLRGRVGRHHARGYCYFITPPRHSIASVARRRLDVLKQLDQLGAGFAIASHDLDIRGAGNVLGEDQSGHIHEIGIELYQKMLRTAVESARQTPTQPDAVWVRATIKVSLGVSAQLAENYIPDLPLRLQTYRRLADTETAQELEDLQAEIIDRFGKLPPEGKNLIRMLGIRNRARALGINAVEGDQMTLRLQLPPPRRKKPDDTSRQIDWGKLIEWVEKHPDRLQLTPEAKLRISAKMHSVNKRLGTVESALQTLESMGR